MERTKEYMEIKRKYPVSDCADNLGERFESFRCSNQDLSFDYAGRFFHEREFELDIPARQTLGLIDKEGFHTNLGMILSDQNIHTSKIGSFQRTDIFVLRDRIEMVVVGKVSISSNVL